MFLHGVTAVPIRDYFAGPATILITGLTTFLSACTGEQAAPNSDLAFAGEIDHAVRDLLSETGAEAGISIAVYTPEGKYIRAYGMADSEGAEAATIDTAFYIASSTKSFLALAMLDLQDQELLNLDTSLEAFAPDVDFGTSIPVGDIKLENLLTHTSGISNEPIEFRNAFSGDHSTEILSGLLTKCTVNPEAPLDTFLYSNIGYIVLAMLTEERFGQSWQDVIKTNLIDRMGLTRTTSRMSVAEGENWSVAKPHLPSAEGEIRRSRLEKNDTTMHAAGGMLMSGSDAAIWLELLVEDGRVGGQRILPRGLVEASRESRVDVGKSFGVYSRDAYGLGWYIGRYGEDTFIHHFGGYPGYRSHISYMPERDIGVAVFVNESLTGSLFADQIANWIYDRHRGERISADDVSGLASRYSEKLLEFHARREKQSAQAWQLALPNSSYVGIYHNAGLGTLEIMIEDNELSAKLGMLSAPLQPFERENSARTELIPLSGSILAFDVEDVSVNGLTWNGEYFRKRKSE